MNCASQLIITTQIEETIEKIEAQCGEDVEIVKIVKAEQFLVDDAKLAVEKAYLASSRQTLIILAAKQFSVVVQNKLLKIIEEPPPNKAFILIAPSKAMILPTVRSRLPITMMHEAQEQAALGLDMQRLDLAAVYAYVQEHKRSDAATVKRLIEAIATEAMRSGIYKIDEEVIALFERAVRLLDIGSVPQFVLTTVLLKLLARKRG